MTFEEWWNSLECKADMHWKEIAKSAWDYQQSIIDTQTDDRNKLIDVAASQLYEIVQLKRKEE